MDWMTRVATWRSSALAVARRINASWIVFENVPGLLSITSDDSPPEGDAPDDLDEGEEREVVQEYECDRDSGFWTFLTTLSECRYGWAYRSLDAQWFGVAQRRERVFAVGHLDNWTGPAAVLFEPESLRGDRPPSRGARQEPPAGALGSAQGGSDDNDARAHHIIAGTLSHNGKAAGSATSQDATSGLLVPTDESGDPISFDWQVTGTERSYIHDRPGATRALTANKTLAVAYGGNDTRGPIDVSTAINAHGGPHGRLDFESETFITQPTWCQELADPLIAHEARTYTHEGENNFRTRNVIAFDTTQITHPENRSNPKVGDPAPTLPREGHVPAVAYSTNYLPQSSRVYDADDVGPTLQGTGLRNGNRTPAVAFKPAHYTRDKDGAPSDLVPTLQKETDRGDMDPVIAAPEMGHNGGPTMRVRRLMPVECERLQGLPDGYTAIMFNGKPAKDGPRYKALGNTMAKPVIDWIAERLGLVDQILKKGNEDGTAGKEHGGEARLNPKDPALRR